MNILQLACLINYLQAVAVFCGTWERSAGGKGLMDKTKGNLNEDNKKASSQ